MNLILCGMMGAGKTTVATKIAETTGRDLYDTDSIIVEKYGQISDIFERFGEKYFRDLETEVVKELSQKDNAVISTGGGLVLKGENVRLLKQNGQIVFLRARLKTLLNRLKADTTRPLLQGADEGLEQRLKRLLSERTPIYERVADYIVDVDEKAVEETVSEVLNFQS